MAKVVREEKHIDAIVKAMLKLGKLGKKLENDPDSEELLTEQFNALKQLEAANEAHAKWRKENKSN